MAVEGRVLEQLVMHDHHAIADGEPDKRAVIAAAALEKDALKKWEEEKKAEEAKAEAEAKEAGKDPKAKKAPPPKKGAKDAGVFQYSGPKLDVP